MNKLPGNYDYIIAGAGSSGLSLLWYIIHSSLSEKRVLLVDASLEPENDKTWCFWKEDPPLFEDIIHSKWVKADIFINHDQIREELLEYPYYCIRSGDYSSYILNEIERHPNIHLLESNIKALNGNEKEAVLTTADSTFTADYIFQSCFAPSYEQPPQYPLVQHFLGWEVETSEKTFEAEAITFMDFDETYTEGVAFMYTLPWSKQSGLLEYTIFSKYPEEKSLYEKKIELYLHNKYNLKRLDYSIRRTEYGEIPMEDCVYEPWYSQRVLNIGARGGLTKPSTGYTFLRIQEHSRQIVKQLEAGGKPEAAPRSDLRYRIYDLWLLQIMHDHPEDALEVFRSLFANNSLDDIFRFLGEKTSFRQDLNIMCSVPWKPFFRAIWNTRNRITSI